MGGDVDCLCTVVTLHDSMIKTALVPGWAVNRTVLWDHPSLVEMWFEHLRDNMPSEWQSLHVARGMAQCAMCFSLREVCTHIVWALARYPSVRFSLTTCTNAA